MLQPTLSSILKNAAKQDGQDLKIAYLREHQSPQLVDLLKFTFDPRVTFMLPAGAAPYKPTGLVDQDTRLYQEVGRLFLMCRLTDNTGTVYGMQADRRLPPAQGNKKVQLQREQIFLQILESIHPDDAMLLINVKDKTLGIKGLTERIVRLAFPNQIYGDNEFFKGEEKEAK